MNKIKFTGYSMMVYFVLLHSTLSPGQTVQAKYFTKEGIKLNSKLINGWNTWNTRSVLSHVLLPDKFSINLALKDQSGNVLEESLIGRDHYDTKERVTPGPHAYDGSYTELKIDWHEIQVKVQTVSEKNNLAVLISPLNATPSDSLIITFRRLWEKIAISSSTGNYSIYINEKKSSDLSTHTSVPLDKKIIITTGSAQSLTSVENRINRAKEKLEKSKIKYGNSSEVYHAMQTVLAWTTIYDPNNDRVINPVSRTFSNDWVLFGWDTYFAAHMLSLDNKELAYANAIAITKEITSRGFVPNNVQQGHKSEDRTEPQVGSIVVKEIYKRYKEKWFLQEVYPELLSWNRWRAANRDVDGYLVHGSDPYDYGDFKSQSATQSGKMKAAKWESGMDNSPMWDDAAFDTINHRMLLADVGLMSLFIADCRSLAEIATILGYHQDSKELNDRAEKYAGKLKTLWDDKFGLFLNKDLVSGHASYRLSPTLFYPLLARVPTQDQANRMMKEHFYNPNEFWGEYILPSAARNDVAYKDNHYWRGRIWAPLNFLVYLGIRNYRLPNAQNDLVLKSKNLLLKTWLKEKHVCENYNADNGLGGEADTWSDAFYHWGALLGFMDIIDQGYVPLPELKLTK